MAIDYTTTKMIADVLRKITAPQAQQLNTTPQRIVDFLNDELLNTMVPIILSVKEEYFVHYRDYDVNDYAITDGYYSVPIPPDAMFEKLRDVCWVNSNGLTTPISRVDLSKANNGGNGLIWGSFTYTNAFYLQDNNVIIPPNNAQGGGTLRLYYLKRPNNLVLTSQGAQVVSVDAALNEVVVTAVPLTWVVGDTLDSISPTQPFGLTANGFEITAISSPTLTVDDVTGIEVGDWICQEGYSTIPKVPVEGMGLLTQAVACQLLEALTDSEGMANALRTLGKYREDFINIITPRVDGKARKVNNLGSGLMGGNGWWGSGWTN